jgi:hypothetical protein
MIDRSEDVSDVDLEVPVQKEEEEASTSTKEQSSRYDSVAVGLAPSHFHYDRFARQKSQLDKHQRLGGCDHLQYETWKSVPKTSRQPTKQIVLDERIDAAATALKGPGTSMHFHSLLCVYRHGVQPT